VDSSQRFEEDFFDSQRSAFIYCFLICERSQGDDFSYVWRCRFLEEVQDDLGCLFAIHDRHTNVHYYQGWNSVLALARQVKPCLIHIYCLLPVLSCHAFDTMLVLDHVFHWDYVECGVVDNEDEGHTFMLWISKFQSKGFYQDWSISKRMQLFFL